MDAVDRILVQLADETTRSAVFDQTALAQMVDAAFDTEILIVEGPYDPVFDQFQLGFSVPRAARLEGNWSDTGGMNAVEARFGAMGLGGSALRLEAFWRGAIVARTLPTQSPITNVEVSMPEASTIDASIIADLGALPTDPEILENERRARLIQRFQAEMDQADAFDGTRLDAWLAEIGANSVSDWMTRFKGTVFPETVRVTFAEAPDVPPSPKLLPITTAIFIRGADFSLAQLLMDSKTVRDQAEPLGLERPVDPALHPRQPLLVVWILPEEVFDDGDWPGGTEEMDPAALRAARRTAAGQWLAREGIGLAVFSSG